jgi:cytochrome c oxidase assembly factor CtaG
MTTALLLSWDWRPEVIFSLGLAAMIYLIGWRRLRNLAQARAASAQQSSHSRLATGWKLAAYWGGLVIVAVALMSPVDILSSQLFFMHMIQHLLLTMIAVPLLLIGNPFPVLVWGLPKRARRSVGGLLNERSTVRRVFAKVTSPGIAWMLYVCALIGWHDPQLYDLALRNQFVHDLQHLTFFVTTSLLWWHILGVAPRFHRSLTVGQRIVYTISVVPVNMIIGVVIAFSTSPIYKYYLDVPRLLGLSVLEDQMIAGILMWIPGSEMFFWVGLIVLTQIVNAEAKKPVDPAPVWRVDEHVAVRG